MIKKNKVSNKKSKQKPALESHKEVINPYNPVPERDKESEAHIETLKKSGSTLGPTRKITDVPKIDKPNDATIKGKARKKK